MYINLDLAAAFFRSDDGPSPKQDGSKRTGRVVIHRSDEVVDEVFRTRLRLQPDSSYGFHSYNAGKR
jgi:hypothetical protein